MLKLVESRPLPQQYRSHRRCYGGGLGCEVFADPCQHSAGVVMTDGGGGTLPAAAMLLDAIEGRRRLGRELVVRPRLVTRDSTAPNGVRPLLAQRGRT